MYNLQAYFYLLFKGRTLTATFTEAMIEQSNRPQSLFDSVYITRNIFTQISNSNYDPRLLCNFSLIYFTYSLHVENYIGYLVRSLGQDSCDTCAMYITIVAL